MKKVTSTTATAKNPVGDEWVDSAMTDVEMVAELILRLKHAVVAEKPSTNLPPLRWGIRQRRSRPSRFGGVGPPLVSLKKDLDSARGSPMTPLSWSGGSGSSSGGGGSASPSVTTADRFEDTTNLQASCSTSTVSGSKAFPTNDITSSCQRFKTKKSSSQLNDEENLKLKERRDLENGIATLQTTFDEENVRNQRLKRIKLDLNSGRLKNETPIEHGRGFFLPDLNMVPSEDEVL